MVQVFVGRVVSTRMQKTVSVLVNRYSKHPRLQKVIRKTKRFLAHDENSSARMGDLVKIQQSRRYSKRKAFRLTDILRRGEGV